MSKANVSIVHLDDGSALRMEFHYQNDEHPGFVRFTFAEIRDGEADYSGGISCDLGFNEITQVLQVIAGETEFVNDGRPMDLGNGMMFAMKHITEPVSGYAMACLDNGESKRQMKFLLKPHEAVGMNLAISGSMFFLAFVKGVNT